ncbi:MAG: hypothetical protein RR547_05020 [Raoultibacter sp.]
MGNKVEVNDHSLLGNVLALVAQKAHTLESLSEALDVSSQDLSIYWVMINVLRRSQGHFLPVPTDATVPGGSSDSQLLSNCWYAPTWYMYELLETFQINEGLAVHYEDILSEPEGGHYELSLAAGEVVAAAMLENPDLDSVQLKRVCVHACEPINGTELLVSNAGKILIGIEEYREEPLTATFIEDLYAKLTEGISIHEVCEIGGSSASMVGDLRTKALESFCMQLCPPKESVHADGLDGSARESWEGGNHTLVNALIALHYFITFRLFPAGNSVFAYVMYFLILHRSGYHFSAHIPVVELLYAQEECGEREYGLTCEPDELAVACDGFNDWTRFFEQALECIVYEQRWIMTKLDGMSRRRERLRVIIDADESMNFRQKEVLLEAVLHSNAEFTYAIHEQRYDVSYPCARSDYARLLDSGFLRQHDDGIRHFFVASDNFTSVFPEYLKAHCPDAFYHYYHEDGSLRDEFKSTEDVAFEYNKDIGFYEKSLLDKTYVEHYDFRRTPIADLDGPHRRGRLKDKP